MADFFDTLTEDHIAFVEAQPVFFTATAAEGSRINLSPKGLDCFRVISPSLVCYMDMPGSGNETSAHLKHDGRITLMFNSFTRNALILRIYGKGRVARPGSDEFEAHIGKFEIGSYARQIMMIDVESVQTSCGYAVPQMEMVKERDTLTKWADSKGPDTIKGYIQKYNQTSIDGLDTGLMD